MKAQDKRRKPTKKGAREQKMRPCPHAAQVYTGLYGHIERFKDVVLPRLNGMQEHLNRVEKALGKKIDEGHVLDLRSIVKEHGERLDELHGAMVRWSEALDNEPPTRAAGGGTHWDHAIRRIEQLDLRIQRVEEYRKPARWRGILACLKRAWQDTGGRV